MLFAAAAAADAIALDVIYWGRCAAKLLVICIRSLFLLHSWLCYLSRYIFGCRVQMYSLRAEYITLRTHTPKTVEKKKKNSLSFVLLARSPYIADLFCEKNATMVLHGVFVTRLYAWMRLCECVFLGITANLAVNRTEWREKCRFCTLGSAHIHWHWHFADIVAQTIILGISTYVYKMEI